MKNVFCIVFLLCGSIGYQPSSFVSIIVYPDLEISGVHVYEIRGDSVRYGDDEWVTLYQIKTLIHHSPETEIAVTMKNDEEYILEEFEVLSDGSISGEGRQGKHEELFQGVLMRDEILSIQNHRSVNPYPAAIIGGILGATVGIIASDPSIGNFISLFGQSATGCRDVQQSALACTAGLAGGGLVGGGLTYALVPTPNTYEFAGMSIDERRQIVRGLLR